MNAQVTPNREALLTNRNRLYIKDFLARPFLRQAAILIIISMIISLLISLTQAFVGLASITDYIIRLIRQSSFEWIDPPAISFGLDFSINNVILVASMLAMYIASRKAKKQSAPLGAVSVFFVWCIITMVGDFISALIYFAIPILVFTAMGITLGAGGTEILTQMGVPSLPPRVKFIAALVFCLVFAVYVVLYIIRGISRFRFGNALRMSISTSSLSARGCKTYATVNIIFCILLFAGTLMSSVGLNIFSKTELARTTEWGRTLSAMPLSFLGICSMIISLLSCVIPILLATFALRYKKHIEAAGENGCNLPEPIIPMSPEELKNS